MKRIQHWLASCKPDLSAAPIRSEWVMAGMMGLIWAAASATLLISAWRIVAQMP